MPLGDPPPFTDQEGWHMGFMLHICEGPGSGETALSDLVSLEADGRVDLLGWMVSQLTLG